MQAARGQIPEPGEDPFDFQSRERMHAQAARGEAGQPGFGPGGSIPGLEGYSHEQIMEMYMKIKNGEVPEELKGMARGGVD